VHVVRSTEPIDRRKEVPLGLLTAIGRDGDPESSPNGRKIVFVSGGDNDDCADAGCASILIDVMNADGTRQQRRTRSA
jgi:hypothetical protein